MARYTILINKIKTTKPFSYGEDDGHRIVVLRNLIQKYGQFEELVVARVDGDVLVIKGQLTLQAMIMNGSKEVCVFFIGNLTQEEFLTAKIFLDVREVRLDYVGIAEAISKVCSTELDCKKMSIETNIPISEIKRYRELLKFDWKQFETIPIIDTGNEDLFGEKIVLKEDFVTKLKYGKGHIERLKANKEKGVPTSYEKQKRRHNEK